MTSPNDKKPKWRSQHPRTLANSFHDAFAGLYHVFDTQPNMRLHTIIVALVLLGAWGVGVTPTQLLHLLLPMVLVLICESFNTAFEEILDLQVDTYNEQVRIIKDVAASAVLISSIYAVVAGVIVFATNEHFLAIFTMPPALPARPVMGPLQIVTIGVLLLTVAIAWVKRASGERKFITWGFASGYTAVGFLLAGSVAAISGSVVLAALGLALALLLAQSRLQNEIHSLSEVALGALIGIVTVVILFAWPVLPA